MAEVVIFGASGYSGLELLRILARHPRVRAVGASSDREAGTPVADRIPQVGGLLFTGHEETFENTRATQIALLATPAKVSATLAPRLLERGLRVVDLSGAFRILDPQAFARWYGFEHPHPELFAEAHYGIPELFEMPEKTRLVANPGCYATASTLAVAPFLELIDGPVVLDGKSGTTGAGRKADESLIYAEVAENLRAYRVGKHQHTPEIERALSARAGREVRVSFTPHLIPMRRGILVSAYLRAKPGVTQAKVTEALEKAYAAHELIRVVERPPETQRTLNTNYSEVGATLDPRTDTLIAFAAIDNLVKGAAGQAVQNLNLLLGDPPGTGLVSG